MSERLKGYVADSFRRHNKKIWIVEVDMEGHELHGKQFEVHNWKPGLVLSHALHVTFETGLYGKEAKEKAMSVDKVQPH